MAYSEARVIAGGLAHIPILIGIFWFINSYFNKRRNNFEKANNPAKAKPIAKPKIKVAEKPPIKKDVCLLYTSPSPRDNPASRMPSSA